MDPELLSQVLQILDNILYVLTKSVTQSVSLSDINPSSYLQVMDNLFRISTSVRTLQEHDSVALKTNNMTNKLAYACSLTQVYGEKAFELGSESVTLNGMRVMSNDITEMVNVSGASFLIPQLSSTDQELVRVSYTLGDNPYISTNVLQPAITSSIFTATFLNVDGSTHEVNKFENGEIMLILTKVQGYTQLEPTVYEYNIPPSLVQTVKLDCNPAIGSLHVVINAYALHDEQSEKKSSFSLVAFLGKETIPTAVVYDQRIYISHSGETLDTVATDTIFIDEW